MQDLHICNICNMSKIYAIYPKCRENLLGQEVSNQKNKKN